MTLCASISLSTGKFIPLAQCSNTKCLLQFLFEFSVESQCAAVDRNKMDDMPLISCKSFVYKKCNELDVCLRLWIIQSLFADKFVAWSTSNLFSRKSFGASSQQHFRGVPSRSQDNLNAIFVMNIIYFSFL